MMTADEIARWRDKLHAGDFSWATATSLRILFDALEQARAELRATNHGEAIHQARVKQATARAEADARIGELESDLAHEKLYSSQAQLRIQEMILEKEAFCERIGELTKEITQLREYWTDQYTRRQNADARLDVALEALREIAASLSEIGEPYSGAAVDHALGHARRALRNISDK